MSRARRLAGNYIWKHNGLSVASLALGGLALGSGNEFVVTQEPRLFLLLLNLVNTGEGFRNMQC